MARVVEALENKEPGNGGTAEELLQRYRHFPDSYLYREAAESESDSRNGPRSLRQHSALRAAVCRKILSERAKRGITIADDGIPVLGTVVLGEGSTAPPGIRSSF